MGNNAMEALAAFGSGFMKAKEKKDERKREEEKWQQQLAVSIGHLNIAKQAEKRQADEFAAQVQAKKDELARRGQDEANTIFKQALDQEYDPKMAHAYAQRVTGYTPQMSPEEGAMWQAAQFANKQREHNAMVRTSEASADRVAARQAAAQVAAMKVSALQSSILPMLTDLAKQGKVPFEAIPSLSEQYARGSLDQGVAGAINDMMRANTTGEGFDPEPIHNLVKDGMMSVAQGAATIAAYKSGNVSPDLDAKVTSLIKQNADMVQIRKSADDLIKEYDVPAELRAAMAADTTGKTSQEFLLNAAEMGLKPKVDRGMVQDAAMLRDVGGNPKAALSGPAAVVNEIAGAPPKVDLGAAMDVYKLGADTTGVKQAGKGGAAALDVLSSLTDKRDSKEKMDAYNKFADSVKLTPEARAQAALNPEAAQQQLLYSAIGFAPVAQDKTAHVPLGEFVTLGTKYGASPDEVLAAINDPTGRKKAEIIARGESLSGKTGLQDASQQAAQMTSLEKVITSPQFVEWKKADIYGPAAMKLDPETGEPIYKNTPEAQAMKKVYTESFKKKAGLAAGALYQAGK